MLEEDLLFSVTTFPSASSLAQAIVHRCCSPHAFRLQTRHETSWGLLFVFVPIRVEYRYPRLSKHWLSGIELPSMKERMYYSLVQHIQM